jgi:hypothetical protein
MAFEHPGKSSNFLGYENQLKMLDIRHHPVERCRAIRTLCSGATPATFYGSLTTKLVAATWSCAVVMAVPKRTIQ